MPRKYAIFGLTISALAEIAIIVCIVLDYKRLYKVESDRKLYVSESISSFTMLAALFLILCVFFIYSIVKKGQNENENNISE